MYPLGVVAVAVLLLKLASSAIAVKTMQPFCAGVAPDSASVAPVVIVEPGLRTLTLEPKTGASGSEPLKIAATLEPAKTYRIGKQADGSLTLVEHGSRAPSSADGR